MNKIFWIFVVLVVLAPLPFGLVFEVTQALFACLVLGLTASVCILNIKQGTGPAVSLGRIWPETAGFCLVLGWGLAQISTFTPEAWHHPLWAETAAALGTEVRGSISLTRGAGFESIMRFLTYGAVFFLALQLGRDRHRAGYMFWAVALAGTGYALYGLAMHFSGLDMVLWVEKTSYVKDVTGTFINRNSFATFIGLGLVCAVGLYLSIFLNALQSRRTGRDRLLHVMQLAFVRGAPLLACVLILLTALFLTNSRAGVTATLVALLVLAVFLGLMTRTAGRTYQALAIAVLAAALGVFLLSGAGWLDRLTATDLEREQRLAVYHQTWLAVAHAPWTGHGLGGFEHTFPIYADRKSSNWDMAHNDWLEMMFELGVPVAAVWFLVLGGLGARCLIGFFTRRRDHLFPLAGFSACLLVGLHALVDFSLQIPAVAATFAVILGVGTAQSWSSMDH